MKRAFAKYLKPKIFVSSMELTEIELTEILGLRCLGKRAFTKYLKPKIFVSSMELTEIELTEILGLRCLVKRAPDQVTR